MISRHICITIAVCGLLATWGSGCLETPNLYKSDKYSCLPGEGHCLPGFECVNKLCTRTGQHDTAVQPDGDAKDTGVQSDGDAKDTGVQPDGDVHDTGEVPDQVDAADTGVADSRDTVGLKADGEACELNKDCVSGNCRYGPTDSFFCVPEGAECAIGAGHGDGLEAGEGVCVGEVLLVCVTIDQLKETNCECGCEGDKCKTPC